MSVRIDAEPAELNYSPPAWTSDAANRDIAHLIGTRSTRTGPAMRTPIQPCAVEDDPDFKLIDRATGALIVAFVLYMAAQFVRAWLDGRL